MNIKRPRVLHIITGLATGGAERALYNLLDGGLSERFDSHVISLGGEGTIGPKLNELGVSVSALNMGAGTSSILGLKRLYGLVRLLQPDLIQGWMYHGNLAASTARFFARGQPALSWNIRHSLYDLCDEKAVLRQVIRANRLLSYTPDALLYNSRLSQQQHEHFGFSSRCSEVIPNGINLEQFLFSLESRHKIRLELGISRDALVVGHVARLHPMKDHSTFLQAAVTLAQRYTQIHFMLSGRGVSLDSEMLAQLIPTQLRDRFHLLGERGDVADVMSAMDVFCQSSWSEAFPNVLGEAMAIGLPCVATDVGDSALIVNDTGVLVPPRDPQALTSGIEVALGLSGDRRRASGGRTRARIEKLFALEAIVDQYAELYWQLMGNKGRD